MIVISIGSDDLEFWEPTLYAETTADALAWFAKNGFKKRRLFQTWERGNFTATISKICSVKEKPIWIDSTGAI